MKYNNRRLTGDVGMEFVSFKVNNNDARPKRIEKLTFIRIIKKFQIYIYIVIEWNKIVFMNSKLQHKMLL